MADTLLGKPERKTLLEYLGHRVDVDLDDGSHLRGRLVSLNGAGTLVLTDVERERIPRKRQRNSERTGKKAIPLRECYLTVVVVQARCVTGVRYTSSLVTDKTVVDSISAREDTVLRTIQVANQGPSMPLP